MRKRHDDIHTTPDVTYIHNPDVAHEASDVNIKAILQFTLGLLIVAILVHFLIWGMIKAFEARSAKQSEKTPPGPMALKGKERLPAVPRLQAAPGFGDDLNLGEGKNLELQAPEMEYKILSKRWNEVLSNGQKNDSTGVVIAIPIEQAKSLLLQQGLPSRTSAEGQESYEKATKFPAYSSAGRTMETRGQ
jgi:hypothetical protein